MDSGVIAATVAVSEDKRLQMIDYAAVAAGSDREEGDERLLNEEDIVSVIRFEPFGDPFRQLDRLTSQLVSGTRTPMGMALDVWQADDGYHVALDLPGVDPADVEITSERNMLTIRADRRAEYEQGQNVLVAERPQGIFTRQLQLGESLDTQKVQARYANGVLHLIIPVAEAAQPRRIEVQSAEAQQSIEVSSGQDSEEARSGDEP
jgi:HSP20 family protein